MAIGKSTDTQRSADVPTLVPDIERSGAPCAGFGGRGRRSTRSMHSNEIERLHRALGEVTPENHPRTAKLLASSTRKVAQKVFEEAGEVALEAVRSETSGIVRESADLLFHLVVLWYRAGLRPEDIWTEMRNRAELLGIAEKLPKERDTCPPTKHRGGDDDGRA